MSKINKLADEVVAAFARKSKVTIRKPAVSAVMGIDTTSMYDHLIMYWRNLARFCDEFWSHTIQWKTQSFGHLVFEATGPEGTKLMIMLTSGKNHVVDAIMDVTKEPYKQTVRKSFEGTTPIHKIIYDLDKQALTLGRKWSS